MGRSGYGPRSVRRYTLYGHDVYGYHMHSIYLSNGDIVFYGDMPRHFDRIPARHAIVPKIPVHICEASAERAFRDMESRTHFV
jgi:hypothetical protein